MRIRCWLWGYCLLFWMVCDSSLAFFGPNHRPLSNSVATRLRVRSQMRQLLKVRSNKKVGSGYCSVAGGAEDMVPTQSKIAREGDKEMMTGEYDQIMSTTELQELIEASPHLVHRKNFHDIFSEALRERKVDQIDQIESLFEQMKQLANCTPTRVTYELMQKLWLLCGTHPTPRDDPEMWMAHLCDLWAMYDRSPSNNDFLPHKSTYLATFKGLLQCRHHVKILDTAETLFDDMLRHSIEHPQLTPDILTANHVMMVWNKFGGQERCRAFLDRLEELASVGGSPQLRPNRYSYCLVLDALAKGHRSAEQAESLITRMKDNGCEPDTIAYNSVLDAWARSKATDAPQRAEAMILQWQAEFEKGLSDSQPNIVSYNTVLHALSHSHIGFRESKRFLDKMDKINVQSNVISYNILIAALADDRSVTNATQTALDLFEKIQGITDQRKRANFVADCATYTSLIKVLSKETDRDHPLYAEKAIVLLEELEEKYDMTKDPALAPNALSYTATISCIGRSGVGPERAHAIVDRMEQRFASKKSPTPPDSICYNALLNAYGWSDMPGKALRCYGVFQRMQELYSTRENVKPDIITCNSVLNACGYENTESANGRESILRAAVEVYEFFRSNAPHYGRLNHLTFDRMLKVVARNLDDDLKRYSMAESVFAQCCLGGHVSVLVVSTLFDILPYDRLAELLGNALLSKKGEPLKFSWKLLPSQYTRFAPRPNHKRFSKGSQLSKVEKPSEYRGKLNKIKRSRSNDSRASTS